MAELSAAEVARIEIFSSAVPESALSQTSTRAALRRCRLAWHRVYKECIKNSRHPRFDESEAIENAAKAYCNAMPLLVGYEGIRDFIACTAYGILIGAIPSDRSGQLLYAAQIALGVLQRAPKTAKPAARTT